MPASSQICQIEPTVAKCSSSTLSVEAPVFVMPTFSAAAPEFVPNSFKAEQVPEFTPYHMSEAQYSSPYDPYHGGQTHYEAPQYPSHNAAANSNCFMISLDGYSDDSDDDEPYFKPAAEQQPKEEAASGFLTSSEEEDGLYDEPKTSAESLRSKSLDSPASTSCGPDISGDSCFDSELSDKESVEEGFVAIRGDHDKCHPDSSFDEIGLASGILTLLKWRHSVGLLDDEESRLTAMEVSPEDLPSEVATQPKPPVSSTRAPARKRAACKEGAKNQGGKKSREVRRERQPVAGGFDFNRGEDSTKLTISDSSWSAQQKTRRCTEHKPANDEEVVRTMKSILNKLTIEKFKPLYEKLVSCGIQTTAQLETLIHEVFEKATTQHHFINMYADLCALLHTHFSENPITDDPKASFKKILLNACQSFFERNLKLPTDLDSLDDAERDEVTLKYKMCMLGNIKFVGALLVRSMLASKVMFAIMEELLTEPTAETLESLACLLTAIGPTFDTPAWPARPMLTEVFNRTQVLAKSPLVKCRVRCLLKDVLELRAAGWKELRPKKVEGPSTLKEVADIQAAEATSGMASKGTSGMNRRPCKVSPMHGGNDKPIHGGSDRKGKRMTTLVSDVFRDRPEPATSKEGYQRISSLAGLKRDRGVDRSRKQPVEQFDQKACRAEVSRALTELHTSREVDEAIHRICALAVPSSHQPAELCEILARTSEEGSEAERKVCFEFIVRLFADGHWKQNALQKGLQDFTEEICPDLKFDVPSLPKIVQNELHPALAPLVETGLLQQHQHDTLVTCF